MVEFQRFADLPFDQARPPFQPRDLPVPSLDPSFLLKGGPPAPAPPVFNLARQVLPPANSFPLPLIQDQPRLPPLLPPLRRDEFTLICADDSVKVNPKQLGFIPTDFWEARDVTFGSLVTGFFQQKNNAHSRFPHKLHNALKIAESDPFFASLVGIEWVSERILKVNKTAFARLLGLKSVDGALFHKQGNFPTHGFVELRKTDVGDAVPRALLETVDYDAVRLLMHQPGVFSRHSTELSIETCRWAGTPRRANQ
jgi:hypothetical protein